MIQMSGFCVFTYRLSFANIIHLLFDHYDDIHLFQNKKNKSAYIVVAELPSMCGNRLINDFKKFFLLHQNKSYLKKLEKKCPSMGYGKKLVKQFIWLENHTLEKMLTLSNTWQNLFQIQVDDGSNYCQITHMYFELQPQNIYFSSKKFIK